jgi:hypothetical protein
MACSDQVAFMKIPKGEWLFSFGVEFKHQGSHIEEGRAVFLFSQHFPSLSEYSMCHIGETPHAWFSSEETENSGATGTWSYNEKNMCSCSWLRGGCPEVHFLTWRVEGKTGVLWLTGWFLSDLVLKIHMAPEIIRIIETNVLPAEWYRHNFREKTHRHMFWEGISTMSDRCHNFSEWKKAYIMIYCFLIIHLFLNMQMEKCVATIWNKLYSKVCIMQCT